MSGGFVFQDEIKKAIRFFYVRKRTTLSKGRTVGQEPAYFTVGKSLLLTKFMSERRFNASSIDYSICANSGECGSVKPQESMMAFCSKGGVVQRVAATATLITMLAASHVVAQEVAPDVLLKAATIDVRAIIRREMDLPASNLATAAEQVDVRILPLFDFTHMTQIAVARHWRAATAVQRQALAAEFRIMLVRKYTASLSNYRDQVIEFKPLRLAAANTGATVKTFVKQPGAEPLTMDYDMKKLAKEWKVYDIKIDGISLVSAFRETFASKVREGGLDGLITWLSDTNQRGDMQIRLHETEALYFPIFLWGVTQGVR